MAKIHIISDSASDIPIDIAERLNIDIVPLTIRFGDEEFVDRFELTPAEFWDKCKASPVLPETAAPSPGAFQTAYERAKAAGAEGVLVVALGSKLSATHQSATLAAQAVADQIPVKVLDSNAVTMAEGMIAIDLAERAQSGASLDDLYNRGVELASKTGVAGTIDTLEHLIKGGRLKGAKAIFGSVLSIKPLLELRDGLVEEAGRARARHRRQVTRASRQLSRSFSRHRFTTDLFGRSDCRLRISHHVIRSGRLYCSLDWVSSTSQHLRVRRTGVPHVPPAWHTAYRRRSSHLASS